MTDSFNSNIERVPRPEHFDVSKWIIDKPFPAEHPYTSHISRFALFPSFDRSASAPAKGKPTSAVDRPTADHQRTRSSLPAAVIVTSKTKGSGEREERIVQSAGSNANRWHEHSFDQLPKYPGAKRQVYYPTPPKLFAPNQDLDSTPADEMPLRTCSTAMATKSSSTAHDAGGATSLRTSGAPTRVIGAQCPPTKQHFDQQPLDPVPAGNFWHNRCHRVTCLGQRWHPPPCPPSTECRPCAALGPCADDRNCYSCPPREVVVHAFDPSKKHHSTGGVARSNATKPHLSCGIRKETLPPDKCPLTLHPAYNYPITGHTYGGLKDCNSCHEKCDFKPDEREPDYKRMIREQHDSIQQIEAANRWQLLESQTPLHDIAALRRKMALSSVKHEPDVFYDHEGRYQRERAGLYKTSYDPALLEYAMNATEQSGSEVCDLTAIERGALDVPTELNASVDEAMRRSRTICDSVTQYNLQPSSYELFRPFDIAKTLQKRHLQPDASSADIRTQEGDIVWTKSTYEGDFNTHRFLHENYPMALHARQEPLQVMSAVNQDLGKVRAFCKVPRSAIEVPRRTTVCCDQHATSTGMQRSLAASLVDLNCHPATHHTSAVGRCPTPPNCDSYEPRQTAQSYDLSGKPCRPPHLDHPWTRCVSGQVKRSGCPSRAEVLARFNDSYAETDATPDLRDNATCGKKHTFTDSVHSQVLRGSVLIF